MAVAGMAAAGMAVAGMAVAGMAAAAGLLEAVAAGGSSVEKTFRLSVALSWLSMAQLVVIPGMVKGGLASAKLYLVAGDNEGDRSCQTFLIKAGAELI